jgi:sodium-dependent dicarboxylate transporter 2/3/5
MESSIPRRRLLGLLLMPATFLLLLWLLPASGLPLPAARVAAVAVLMAGLWISEAIPIPATALLPIALFPVLEVMPVGQVTAAYANHLIYLFMGGFLIAMAIEKWQLHRRLALHTVRLVGESPGRLVLGFMLATAALSAWISNTAASMMMVTMGLALLRQLDNGGDDGQGPFAPALMLGIAYGASIGGVATLIGTPPNAILAGILETRHGISIGFMQWMSFGLPLAALMLLLTWLYLTRVAFPLGSQRLPLGAAVVREELQRLGPMNRQERAVLGVFALVVAGWLLRGLVGIGPLVTDSVIAIGGALLLFFIPADLKRGTFLLDWDTAVKLPWDVIVLFGGGFALAAGFAESGLTLWLGEQLSGLAGMPPLLLLLVAVLLVIFLTELTSNTATASMLLPVMGGFALALDMSPLGLMVGAALAASFAFMLPVATPPNAIVFASRRVSIPQMARAGVWLNLLASLVVVAFVQWLLPLLWD